MTNSIDWYDRRDELEPGMTVITHQGEKFRLDHRVPGDGTDWCCDVWYEGQPGIVGYENGHWSCDEARIHPGDIATVVA